MRPPMATDHVVEPRLRVRLTKKYAPYNSGEERCLAESVARRLCVLGVAVPSPKRFDLTGPDGEQVEDKLGGWVLSGEESTKREQFDRARKETAGDYKDEQEQESVMRREEEARVQEQADAKKAAQQVADEKTKKKPGGFLRGARKGRDAQAATT